MDWNQTIRSMFDLIGTGVKQIIPGQAPAKTKKNRFHPCSRHRMATVQHDTFNPGPGNNAAVSKISSQLDNCKDLVTKVKRTGFQKELKKNKCKTLKQECSTRWDTKHTMVESILTNKEMLKTVDNKDLKEIILKLDFTLLSQLEVFLKEWEKAGLFLSSETKPTLCRVLPTRYSLRKTCVKLLSSPKLKPLKTHFTKAFDKKFYLTPTVKLAAFLWPRYRNHSKLFTIDDYDEIEKEAEAIMIKTNANNNTSNDQLQRPSKVPKLLRRELGSIESIKPMTLQQEIALYRNFIALSELTMPVLSYWRSAKLRFPLLSVVAMHVHVIPATQISTERRFNVSGIALDKRRSNLQNQRFEAQVNINKNYPLCPFLTKDEIERIRRGSKNKSESDYDGEDEDEGEDSDGDANGDDNYWK